MTTHDYKAAIKWIEDAHYGLVEHLDSLGVPVHKEQVERFQTIRHALTLAAEGEHTRSKPPLLVDADGNVTPVDYASGFRAGVDEAMTVVKDHADMNDAHSIAAYAIFRKIRALIEKGKSASLNTSHP